jgi:hypothetical protein
MAQICTGISRQQRLYDADDALDIQRGPRSLKSLYEWYTARDPNRKKRERKTRDDDEDGS